MINEELTKEYFKLHESLSELKEKLDDAVKTVQDQQGEKKGVIVRDNKEIEIKEKTMGQEVYHFGLKGHQSADYLRAKYPDVFKMVDDSEELVSKIKVFEMANLGFEFSQMNGANLLKLVRSIVRAETNDNFKKLSFWQKIKNLF